MSGIGATPTPTPVSEARAARASAEGAWTLLFEDLLRGLVHTINNRVTALSAFAELSAMEGETLGPHVLRQEITRLHDASALVAILSTRGDDVEALELRAVLEVALGIHAHHPHMRDVLCTIEQSGAVLPVRVPRWALLRLFLLLVDAAKRAGDAAKDVVVCMQLSGDDELVRAFVASPEPLSEDVLSLAAACGGTLAHAEGGIVLELPSLLALRRRERG